MATSRVLVIVDARPGGGMGIEQQGLAMEGLGVLGGFRVLGIKVSGCRLVPALLKGTPPSRASNWLELHSKQ